MNQQLPTNIEELQAFRAANSISEDNKALWIELWQRGCYVQAVGQLHVGEIDYLIVTCAPPALSPKQLFAASSN